MAPSERATPAPLDSLPKVELHLHLEGSISARRATDLARRHGEDPATALLLEDGGYPRRYAGFGHFLRTFLASTAQIRTPDDLTEVTADLARGQQRQGVIWSEVTFTALAHVRAGMEPRAMWRAVRDGLAEAPGTRVGLIVDVVRDEGPEAAERTVRLVDDADAPIVGLGLTGQEGSVPEREFRLLRTAADDLGLGLTVHAGETGPAPHVHAAIEELAADRIGHGLAVLDDPGLTRRLALDGVPLEVCPSSNVALGLVPRLEDHPLPAMRDAGLRTVIGSDDPPFFATTLTRELAHAADLLELDRAGLADLQRLAARVAFAPADVVDDTLTCIDAWEANPGR